MSEVPVLDSRHCHSTKGQLAHTPHSSHRAAWSADSPQVYFAVPALLYHRPCRVIAESAALARARPTRLLWPENHWLKPAALTRRLIVLAVIPKTAGLASPRRCRSPSKAVMARRVMNTTSPSPV